MLVVVIGAGSGYCRSGNMRLATSPPTTINQSPQFRLKKIVESWNPMTKISSHFYFYPKNKHEDKINFNSCLGLIGRNSTKNDTKVIVVF